MTETPEVRAGTPALVERALEHVRLQGALFFRSELTEPFQLLSTPLAIADNLVAGADRLTIFHIVASGRCWVAGPDGERHWAEAGDVMVMPYGDDHVLGGAADSDQVLITSLLDPFPWAELPVLRHGGGGTRTDLVCGFLHSGDPLFDPRMQALPPAFVVRLPHGPATDWVRASIDYALQDGVPLSNQSGNPLAMRLPELLLIEVLRVHLATAPAVDRGWMAALRDPVLAPALALIHNSPAHHWTVAELAACAAVSRSVLDERFRTVLGLSPIRYLTAWRMHLSTELLTTTDLSVAAVGRRTGYDSEEAFSRAFKRERGRSPSHWRGDHANPVSITQNRLPSGSASTTKSTA